MAVENRLGALCFPRSSRATRASRATNLRPSGLVALGLAERRQSYVRGVALSRQSYSRRSCCWPNGIDIARCCRRAIFFLFSRSSIKYFPASGQTVVTGVVPSSPRFLPSIFIAHRVQQSHCSSTFHRVLLTHALALSASQFVHKKKSQRIYTSMHLLYTAVHGSSAVMSS